MTFNATRKVLSATLFIILAFSACKKDKITVNQEKEFTEVGFIKTSDNSYNNPYRLTLKPNGNADILPGGDIVRGGTYEISGSNLTVVAETQTYKFEIISEREIKLKPSGLTLKLSE